MLQKNYQRFSLLLLFGLFFLSNASAFFTIIWLAPAVVLLELALWLILAAFSVWILSKRKDIPAFFENVKRNWFILPFLVFSGLSVFWSVYWEISVYRWLILLCTIVAGGYIGLRYTVKKLIELLSVFGIYILLLSAILVFFAPRIGIMNYYDIQGAWKGLYWHKNHMGLISTFVNLLFLFSLVNAVRSKSKQIWFWGLLYVFSLVFVVQSDSAAALIVTIVLHGMILLAIAWLKFKDKIRGSHYLIFIVSAVVASLILYFNMDHVFGVFNRNTTLTGRVPMWAHLYNVYFSQRPFLGYGFNAFWYIESYRETMHVLAGYPDQIVISDNGFIDILMNTGYIGLSLFLFFYFGVWWRSFQYMRKARNLNDLFPVILMSYTLLANISWSLLFENEGFFMLIMLAVLFSVTSRFSDERLP